MIEENKIEPSILDKELSTKKLIDVVKDLGKKSTSIQNQSITDPVHYSNWLTLLGFESEDSALQFIKMQGYKQFDEVHWKKLISSARSVVDNIVNRKNLQPEIRDLDQKYFERISKLQSEPTFQEHLIGMKTHRFALVEISKVHCFQKLINLEFIDSLLEKIPNPDNLDETVKFCLPTRDEKSKVPILSAGSPNNMVSFISENTDFRILGTVQGEDPNTGRSFSGFQFGFGLPLISVVNYNGTYLIKNGYHRAYALMKKGHKFLPCLLVTTDNFQSTGAQSNGFFPIDLILSDKSPILSDFNSDAAVLIPRRRFRKMVTIHAEEQIIPL